MWLDVARYADSTGYEFDFDFQDAWRYRDYVIKAFNEDKPYDQFITEQIAGDELEHPTFDSVTATGFVRLGPAFTTGIWRIRTTGSTISTTWCARRIRDSRRSP